MHFAHHLYKKLALVFIPVVVFIAAVEVGSESLPQGIARLLAAYPGKLCKASANEIIWCDGTTMVYDDGRKKSFDEKLVDPDLEDQMSIEYPLKSLSAWPLDSDPGRIRHEPFFKKMYGSSPEQVRQKLKPVIWLPKVSGKKVMVTSVNGVDKKLRAVSKEVQNLPAEIVKKVSQPSGTFVWRNISGTKRLSSHSFGIAIDVGKKYSDYWRWAKPGPDGRYKHRNRIPLEVVEIFERNGFIWGGKWYHFDTMHFEYRPELLPLECKMRRWE